MKGFFFANGKQGSGKTLLMVKHLVDEHLEHPNKKIFSNTPLFNLDYQFITFDKNKAGDENKMSILEQLDSDPNYFNHSIMLLDEIHLYLNSLDFFKNNNRALQTFFSQLRKRDILLLATSQYFHDIDIRVRSQALNSFEMEHIYKDLFVATTCRVLRYDYIEEEVTRLKLSMYYDYFDTNYLILE